MTATPPKWKDEATVANWVIARLEAVYDDEEYSFAMLPWETDPGLPLKGSGFFASIEAWLGFWARYGRNLKVKRKRGRPKQTVGERFINNPVHDAASEMHKIEHILRVHYPKETGIRERAIAIAAARARINRRTLRNYLRAPYRLR